MSVKFSVIFFIAVLHQTTADIGCLYGWKLSASKELCELNCNGIDGSRWNNMCESAPLQFGNIRHNTIDNNLYMAAGKSLGASNYHLPSCYNLTSVNMPCYPLSPQLLQCQLQHTQLNDYYIENGDTIVIPTANITAHLGDFYIDRNKTAFTCEQTIQNHQMPRCNYVVLHADQYRINDNGSMYIYGADFTIRNPVYSVVIGKKTIVCIPLSVQFVNCQNHLSTKYFVFDRNMRAINFITFGTVKPDEYFINDDGKLMQCESDPIFNRNQHRLIITLTCVYVSISAVASVVMLVTIILVLIRRKDLITNNHMIYILHHIFFLVLSNVAFIISSFYQKDSIFTCYLLFAFNYFCNLSLMCWLNVVTFDLWRIFRRTNSCVRRRRKRLHEYFLYSVYGVGLPLVLTGVTIIIDLSPELCGITFGYCPHINSLYFCWFNNLDAANIYYSAPFTAMTLLNVLFLCLTICAIHRTSSETEIVNPQWKQQMLRVSIKLLVLTTLCYVCLFVCFLVTLVNNDHTLYTTFIYCAIIIAQGIAIFLIYYKKCLSYFNSS